MSALEPTAPAPERHPLIRLRGVTRTFGTGTAAFQALRGVDLDVRAGELIALMGPSGSGKSTALNILGALDVCTSGSLQIEGIELGDLDPYTLACVRRRVFGYVFQGYNLLPRATALENVELPLRYRRTPAARRRALALEALGRVGLAEWADHRPSQLSGGQQQRVAIARAVVTDPPVVLADEPTGNLDRARSRDIIALLCELNRDHGMTVVIVTHDPEVARQAERVIWFEDGRVVDAPRPVAADGPAP
ncbi:MAG: ABC transporter ATP-binding protein [Alphaproteobacteria bacterium]|jgi:putative ABC transport system ATP-binding protein|nr:ABC transporter ATP-binding protein [Burkholderiaceae bacterium]